MNFTLACDIMMDLEGSIRPAVYLAHGLLEKGFEVSMMSPAMSKEVEESLRLCGIEPMNLGARLFAKRIGLSMLWFEAWGREAFLRLNSRNANRGSHVTVNFSHTLAIPSTFWYLQGPTSSALRDMEDDLTRTYKSVYKLLKPALEYADRKLAQDMSNASQFVFANSKFCASLYQGWGIGVSDIIYPPIDCKLFQPSSSNPSSDYAATYFGKETKFSVIKAIADTGVKIKAFGSKAPFIPSAMTTHRNIEFLGKVSVNELVDIYSNALFTLFPFTHEPFGYIPVESMACGTPTLTYNTQGPSESVTEGQTGWLVNNDREIQNNAIKIWKLKYSQSIRRNCVRDAARFDRSKYVTKWLNRLGKSIL